MVLAPCGFTGLTPPNCFSLHVFRTNSLMESPLKIEKNVEIPQKKFLTLTGKVKRCNGNKKKEIHDSN